MNKKAIIIYDDTRKPNRSIRSITGGKSFGNTIFKRITLRERMRDMLLSVDGVAGFVTQDAMLDDVDSNNSVILLYSDCVVNDEQEIKVLVEKSLYSHDNYKVTLSDGKIACVIFQDVASYLRSKRENHDDYKVIEAEAFLDIADVMNFRRFITSGFEARFFNSLLGDEYVVTKSSDNVKKLYAEYMYYSLLPDSMKKWFVMPYDYKEDNGRASYSMQRYHMTDLAIRYVHGAIDDKEFASILEKLFFFLKERKEKATTHEEYEQTARALYIDKVDERIEQLKKSSGYEKIAGLISQSTCYQDIDEVVAKYKSLYEKIRLNRKFKDVSVVGHGDLCFSNILYSNEVALIKLIDPKGATCEADLYTDPYYDIAKLSHSICGHYDFYNSDRYEIVLDEDLKAHLTVDANNRSYVEIFKNELERCGIDFKLIRIYEASLFISMLPLHMDRPKKVFAFILNAIAILESLED